MRIQTFDIARTHPHKRKVIIPTGRIVPLSGLGCAECGGTCGGKNLGAQSEAREAINVAEMLGVGMIAFQAIAALSGLGIFLIQAKAYGDRKRASRKSR